MADEQIYYVDERGRKVSPHGEILDKQDPIQGKPEAPQGHSEPLTPEAQAKEADAKAKAEADAKAKAGK